MIFSPNIFDKANLSSSRPWKASTHIINNITPHFYNHTSRYKFQLKSTFTANHATPWIPPRHAHIIPSAQHPPIPTQRQFSNNAMVYRQTRGKRQTTTLDACASWDTWRLAVATTPAPATLTAYNPIKHTTYRDEYKERLRLAVCVQKK